MAGPKSLVEQVRSGGSSGYLAEPERNLIGRSIGPECLHGPLRTPLEVSFVESYPPLSARAHDTFPPIVEGQGFQLCQLLGSKDRLCALDCLKLLN